MWPRFCLKQTRPGGRHEKPTRGSTAVGVESNVSVPTIIDCLQASGGRVSCRWGTLCVVGARDGQAPITTGRLVAQLPWAFCGWKSQMQNSTQTIWQSVSALLFFFFKCWLPYCCNHVQLLTPTVLLFQSHQILTITVLLLQSHPTFDANCHIVAITSNFWCWLSYCCNHIKFWR